jgi:endonuclease III
MGRPIDIDSLRKSRLYSEELGINLWGNEDGELFKWFLASLLFGARISETIARHTYRTFEKYSLLEPRAILKAGRDFLVNPVMREGGYVRYDGITSTKVLGNCETLLEQYQGSLKELHRQACDSRDLERRLTSFRGVGPVTANIFLRELRPIWEKSDPDPLPVVRETAAKCGVDLPDTTARVRISSASKRA